MSTSIKRVVAREGDGVVRKVLGVPLQLESRFLLISEVSRSHRYPRPWPTACLVGDSAVL